MEYYINNCSASYIYSQICVGCKSFLCLHACSLLCRCKIVIQAAESEADKSSENKSKAKKTISRVAYNIWRNEGIPGFFKGLEAQILKTVLGSALLLMIKEKITKTTWVIMLALRQYLLASRPKLKSA